MAKKTGLQKLIFLIVGIIMLVGGITLVLAWWDALLVLVKGALGIALALVGLILLYMIRD